MSRARLRPKREQHAGSEATFAPIEAARRDPATNTRHGGDAPEAALWREFHRAGSVADLARALAARIGEGTRAEEFIAAANGAPTLGSAKPARSASRALLKNQAL